MVCVVCTGGCMCIHILPLSPATRHRNNSMEEASIVCALVVVWPNQSDKGTFLPPRFPGFWQRPTTSRAGWWI